MAITLRLVDQRIAGKTNEITSQIPFPSSPLSVWRAAQMTVQRAREKGYEGTGRYFVLLHKPDENGRAIRLDAAQSTWVPDNGTVTVGVDSAKPREASDRWLID